MRIERVSRDHRLTVGLAFLDVLVLDEQGLRDVPAAKLGGYTHLVHRVDGLKTGNTLSVASPHLQRALRAALADKQARMRTADMGMGPERPDHWDDPSSTVVVGPHRGRPGWLRFEGPPPTCADLTILRSDTQRLHDFVAGRPTAATCAARRSGFRT